MAKWRDRLAGGRSSAGCGLVWLGTRPSARCLDQSPRSCRCPVGRCRRQCHSSGRPASPTPNRRLTYSPRAASTDWHRSRNDFSSGRASTGISSTRAQQVADARVQRGVELDVEHARALAQDPGRATADDHGIAALRGFLDHRARDRRQALLHRPGRELLEIRQVDEHRLWRARRECSSRRAARRRACARRMTRCSAPAIPSAYGDAGQ